MPTQTTSTQYPPWLEEIMQKVTSETSRMYDAGAAPNFYPNDTVANFTPDQIMGQNTLRNLLTGTGPTSPTASLTAATNANNQLMNPNLIWGLDQVPGYMGIREGIKRDAGQNLSENYMPSVRSASLAGGMFGGSRGQIGEALAAARSTDELSKNLSGLDMQTFGTLLNAQSNAITRAPGLATASMIPAQGLMDLGLMQQNQNQTEITGDRERFDFNQAKPWWLLDQLRTSAGGAQGGTTTTQSSQESDPNFWQTIGGVGSLLLGGGAFGDLTGGGVGGGFKWPWEN